ncbi:MAG: hypothetical protein HY682_12285 [Chloroflexi bacterium]|nr:hypothetical protein [Chloroflexota bacterium]
MQQTLNRRNVAIYLAAALSFGAAVLHAWLAPEHFEHWWGYGAYFCVAASAQGFFGFALLAFTWRWLLPAGIALNLLMIGIYVWTRTSGIPLFGPHAGEVEQIAGIDIATNLAEFALVLLLVPMLRRLSPEAAVVK